MTERSELMIGDFARRARLPVSTLRYYDRIGLLTPTVVEPGSGYRRYTLDQLPAATLISRLRSLGIAPNHIRCVLDGGLAASATLLRERRRIAAEIELGRHRLSRLDELLDEGPSNDYRVEIVELPARAVAARRFRLPVAGLEVGVTRAIAGLRSTLRRGGHQRTGAWGATFPVDLSDEVSGFVFAPIAGGRRDDVDTAWLPAARAVTTVHRGSPAGLPMAYHAAFAALDELAADAVGPVIEEYATLDEPGATSAVTHVRIPFDCWHDGDQPSRSRAGPPPG